jgi:hypothetical protein
MVTWPHFLPDLTLWHEWHAGRGTLPAPWTGLDLPAVCAALGVRPWAPRRPWKARLPGIEVHDQRGASERALTWTTARGTLTSRWALGPDGDWWQSEYPVKSHEDLEAACLVAEARRYLVTGAAEQPARPGEITVVELPLRPWSELFHSFLGWSDGLMLFMEEADALRAVVDILEEKLAGLERELARLPFEGRPFDAALLPDNLDGQFISPDVFEESLAPSYSRAASAFHAAGTGVVVHVGGPAARLLPGLAACGVDCVEGVCGPPQGDSTLAEARSAAGPGLVLWGGIPQDVLLSSCSDVEFRSAAAQAFSQAAGDPGIVLGVADRVPAQALLERLAELVRMGRGAR